MRLFVLLLAVKASGLAVRLNKLLPGLSRRKADAAIAAGRVRGDGGVAEGRTPVERGSEVRLDGETQVWEAREAAKADLKSSDAFLYLKYWKPAGVTCTSDRNDASNVIARGGFDDLDQRVFHFPEWVRVRVVSPETLEEVGVGETGLLQVFDLANIWSALAIQTEDLAVRCPQGFSLKGRASFAEPKGCSLLPEA